MFWGFSSLEGKSGGRTTHAVGCSAGGVPDGGVAAFGAGAGGGLAEESPTGGEAEEAADSFDAGGGDLAFATEFCSSGVVGPEWTGGSRGFSERGGEVGRGRTLSSFAGGE